MNERIRELMLEVGFVGYGEDLGSYNIPVPAFNSRMEKFAELIVWDCLDQIESQRSSGENSDQWTITRDLCYHNMMAVLKQHFGLKQQNKAQLYNDSAK